MAKILTEIYWEKYGQAIIGKMQSEGALDNSDDEITRCLSGCVAGELLICTAINARREGLFVWEK